MDQGSSGLPPPPPQMPGEGDTGVPFPSAGPIGPSARRRGPLIALVAVVVAAVGVAAVVTLTGGGGPAADDEAAVRELLLLEDRLFKDGRYDEVYDHFSAAVKTDCSLDSFVGQYENVDPSFDPNLVRFEDIHVTVEGDRAEVTYSFTYDGEEVLAVTASDPDLFVRVGGVWFDDRDAYTGCLQA